MDSSINYWNNEINNKVQSITKNIKEYKYDFNFAIKVLDSLFKGNKEINISMIIVVLKRLIKSYLQMEDIKIYIMLDEEINGFAYTDGKEKIINLNYNLINKLLNVPNHYDNPESIHILETIFHEVRHIEQFMAMNEENMNDEIYYQYKENLISCISSGYYSKNYIGVSYEKDARITG